MPENFKDTRLLFRLAVPVLRWADAALRFRVRITRWKDTALRFRLAGRIHRDVALRYKLILPRYKDVSLRFRVHYPKARVRAWNGSTWVVPKKLQHRDGASWVTLPVRVWDGVQWRMALERDHWDDLAVMNETRRLCGFAAFRDKLYVFGGRRNVTDTRMDSVEEYDPTTDSWTLKTDMPADASAMAVFVIDPYIYVAGGSLGDDDSGTHLWRYDPVANLWSVRAVFPTGREDMAAAAVNGLGYIFGGYRDQSNTVQGLVHRYNPDTNTWSTMASLAAGQLRGMHAAAWNGKIYLTGGRNSSGGVVALTYEYDPVANSYTAKTSMNSPRYGHVLLANEGCLFAIGGTWINRLASIERYDIRRNVWQNLEDHPFPRDQMGGAVLNGLLYLAGGDIDGDVSSISNLTRMGY